MGHDSPFNPAVIAPTFNNARTLLVVLRGIEESDLPVIVINDGCTDGTADLLQAWQQSGERRSVLTHGVNRGKAAALRTGFAHAVAGGFTHAVTIDTDGQLDPAEIPKLLRTARHT